jgi:hypothetical protein
MKTLCDRRGVFFEIVPNIRKPQICKKNLKKSESANRKYANCQIATFAEGPLIYNQRQNLVFEGEQ